MQGIRRCLSAFVAVWLLAQIVTFATAPTMAAMGIDVPECCRHVAPGQSCPMHHAREGDRTCKMRSGCPRADFALVSMSVGAGILPDATDVVTAFEPGAPAIGLEASALTRAERPDAPPPRA